jgi:hypothetical protein
VESGVNVLEKVDGERKIEASSRMARTKSRRRESLGGEAESSTSWEMLGWGGRSASSKGVMRIRLPNVEVDISARSTLPCWHLDKRTTDDWGIK